MVTFKPADLKSDLCENRKSVAKQSYQLLSLSEDMHFAESLKL